MRLLDTYALNTGSKISKPFIYSKFFPLNVEKYITLQAKTPYDSRNYAYWQEVIDGLNLYLSKYNIYIVQVGTKDETPYNGVINLLGHTSINQLAYVIERSNLHFGSDSLCVHLASHYDKPIVSLYSISNPNVAGPHFGDKSKHILLKGYERIGNKKPSYSQIEHPKSINTIKPEEIIKAVLDLLNIKHDHLNKTLFFGQDYNLRSFEVIPDDKFDINNVSIDNPIIRMDYFFNEKALEDILKNKKCIIFTDKPIKKDILEANKTNINQLIYIIDENNDVKFAKLLKSNSIPYVLLSFLDQEILNKYKFDYMDYNLIINKKHKTKEDLGIKIDDFNNLRYKSSRLLLSSKGESISKYDWLHGTKDKVIDDPEFWKEIDNFYIYSIDN